MVNLITYSGKLFQPEKNDFFTGYKEINIPKIDPNAEWTNGKISEKTWTEILGFFKWSYDRFKGETQIRLFFNTETKEWAAYPYKQQVTYGAMTTEDEHDEEARALFPDPWVYLGTGHHHCSTSAFQSSVDHEDEANQDGIHFTIGNMDKKQLDFHARISWSGEFFPLPLENWLEIPKWVTNIPMEDERPVLLKKYMLANYDYPFPEEWKDQVQKKTTTIHNQWSKSQGYQGYAKQTGKGNSKTKTGKCTGNNTQATTTEKLMQCLVNNLNWTTSEIYLATNANDENYLEELKKIIPLLRYHTGIQLNDKQIIRLLTDASDKDIVKTSTVIKDAIDKSKKNQQTVYNQLGNDLQHVIENQFQVIFILQKYSLPITYLDKFL